MEMTEVKVEVVEQDDEDEFCDEPLALVKRKITCEPEVRDITDRFPYIEEVTTTTPRLCEAADDTVTSTGEKGEACLFEQHLKAIMRPIIRYIKTHNETYIETYHDTYHGIHHETFCETYCGTHHEANFETHHGTHRDP